MHISKPLSGIVVTRRYDSWDVSKAKGPTAEKRSGPVEEGHRLSRGRRTSATAMRRMFLSAASAASGDVSAAEEFSTFLQAYIASWAGRAGIP